MLDSHKSSIPSFAVTVEAEGNTLEQINIYGNDIQGHEVALTMPTSCNINLIIINKHEKQLHLTDKKHDTT